MNAEVGMSTTESMVTNSSKSISPELSLSTASTIFMSSESEGLMPILRIIWGAAKRGAAEVREREAQRFQAGLRLRHAEGAC